MTNHTDHLDRNAVSHFSFPGTLQKLQRIFAFKLHFQFGFNCRETLPKDRDHRTRLKHTVVFSSEPQKEPDWKDFSPGHLQLLDEQAEQERLGGQSEAIERLTGRREEEHSSVVLTAQERARECHVVQFFQELP